MTLKGYYKRKQGHRGKKPFVKEGVANERYDHVMDYSMVGLFNVLAAKGKKGPGIGSFSYFDREKKQCKLCYESCYSVKTGDKEWRMYNTLDNKPHRVKIKKSWYCKMAKKSGHEFE